MVCVWIVPAMTVTSCTEGALVCSARLVEKREHMTCVRVFSFSLSFCEVVHANKYHDSE